MPSINQTALPCTPLTVIGAKFKPIIITTAPVTTGGMSFNPLCACCHHNKTNDSIQKPQAMIPPNATDRFELAPLPWACAVAVATTPIKAKLEPK